MVVSSEFSLVRRHRRYVVQRDHLKVEHDFRPPAFQTLGLVGKVDDVLIRACMGLRWLARLSCTNNRTDRSGGTGYL